MEIGKKIAFLRKQQNFTQEQLAREVGVSVPAVSKWETGAAMPDISLLMPSLYVDHDFKYLWFLIFLVTYLINKRADVFAGNYFTQISDMIHVEDNDRHLVFLTQGCGRQIHDFQTA